MHGTLLYGKALVRAVGNPDGNTVTRLEAITRTALQGILVGSAGGKTKT